MLWVVCDELDYFELEEGPWSVLVFGQYTVSIEELCPFTDLCSTKLGYEVDRSASPCCMGCSCESDCGLTQNCCFPELDLFELPVPDEDYSSCVFPVTQVYAENLPIHGYTMIDRCPLESACDACGDQKVADWGSLYPIYSNNTGLIYKNQICAECYNITDGIVWEPFQIANLKDTSSTLPTRGHLLTSKLGDRNNMTVRFMPPDGNDFDRLACFENIIDSCEPDGAYFLFDNFTDHEMCDMGLYAPYFYNGEYYSNKFCAICVMTFNQRRKDINACTPQHVEPAGDFVASIDKDLTYQYGESETKQACTPNGKKCTDVLCPIGHIRIDDSCVLFHSKWLNKNIQLVLEFNPKTENDRVSTYTLDNVDVSISLPSETKWLLKTVVVEQSDSNDILRVYTVMLWNQTQLGFVKTADIIDSIPELVEQSKCIIRYVGTAYTYYSDISRYAFFDETNHHPLWRIIKESTNRPGEPGSFDTQTTLTAIYTHNGISTGNAVPISVNKLLFCEQIDINEDEFISYFNETQIYQKSNGKTYFDGEFLLMEQKDGTHVARVCLKDSGYHVTGSGSYKMVFGTASIAIPICVGYLLHLIF